MYRRYVPITSLYFFAISTGHRFYCALRTERLGASFTLYKSRTHILWMQLRCVDKLASIVASDFSVFTVVKLSNNVGVKSTLVEFV